MRREILFITVFEVNGRLITRNLRPIQRCIAIVGIHVGAGLQQRRYHRRFRCPAQCRGVQPPSSLAFTWPPAMGGFSLFPAVKCRGVLPSSFFAYTSASAFSNASVTAAFSLNPAQCKGVSPSSFFAERPLSPPIVSRRIMQGRSAMVVSIHIGAAGQLALYAGKSARKSSGPAAVAVGWNAPAQAPTMDRKTNNGPADGSAQFH